MSDYFADLHPIHARLPIMELDDLTPENYKVLHEYAERVVKKDENGSKKKHLNDILDELTSVYILMTFSEWDGDTPLANIHKIIGKAMTIDGECERFLYEHGLNDLQYSELEEAAIPINPTPLHKYVDEMVFTIDPPTSTDLDDALSIQKLDSKHFRVGIHIADVTSYLGLIDREEIIKRTTSVYLPYRVYHMLNRNMVKVCSLDPGVERLAFSIWVVMDLEGNVVGESVVEKSIIKSRFKLSYGVVQDLISGNMDYPQFNSLHTCTQDEFEQLLEKLLNMTELATLHRSQRIVFDVFENRELEFKLDENRWPNECFVEKRYTAKKMVEEFMIIGNIESAKVIIKASPSNALVIHHPKPSKLAVTSFNEQFKNLELKFKFENVLDVQRQLIKIEENTEIDEQTKQVLFFRARRAMEPAIYRTYAEITQEAKELDKEKEGKERKEGEKAEEYPIIHFALGLQFYTHFTSPMRRMADILVHETLTQIITNQPLTSISSSEIEKINNGRKGTKRLKKDLNEIYLCLMIYHTKKPIECEGIISSFGLESVSIFIPLFDMQKEVLWKKEFKIYSIKRIRNKDNQLDVKLYHDPKTAKKDVYWVIQVPHSLCSASKRCI
jgi:exoribonuclease R